MNVVQDSVGYHLRDANYPSHSKITNQDVGNQKGCTGPSDAPTYGLDKTSASGFNHVPGPVVFVYTQSSYLEQTND